MSFNFGANAANKSPFGAAAGIPKAGVFGSTPTATTSAPSMFGASPSAPNFSFGSSGAQPAQSSIFGARSPPSTQQPSAGFNFGQTGQPAAGLFGANPQTQSGGGLINFGGARPATGAPAWPSFGSPAASATSVAPAVGQFGQPATASAFGQAAASGIFGQPAAAPAFGQTNPPASSFGQTAAPAFGQTAPPSFGQTAAPAATSPPLNAGFGFGATKPAQAPTATSPTSSFGFGQPAASPLVATSASPNFSAFNFTQSPAAQKPAIGFGTAAPTNPTANAVSFNFTSPVTAAVASTPGAPMFGFSGTAATTANVPGAAAATVAANPSSTSIGFSSPAQTLLPKAPTATLPAAPALGFPSAALPQASTAATQPGFSFPSPNTSFASPLTAAAAPTSAAVTAAPKPATLPTFAAPAQPSAAQPPSFSFAPASTATAPAAPAATTTATPAPPTFSGFQLPTGQPAPVSAAVVSTDKPKPLGGGITLGAAPVLTATSATPTLSLPAATSAAPGSAASAPAFQLSVPATSSTATSLGLTAPTATSTAAPTQPAPVTSMNFGQLEDAINKWSLELEEQEKLFINQATQVNAWDKLLIVNGEKIVTLNESLQSVRNEQQSLDHELDFILGQQRELEELLVPLEKELANVVISDPEREHTYRLADGIDTQLKQMSEDLKETIEHLNESNRREDNNDPIVQIGRILNAHMSSMHWIDTQTAAISNKLGQLSSMHNALKRQNKRSFHLTYN